MPLIPAFGRKRQAAGLSEFRPARSSERGPGKPGLLTQKPCLKIQKQKNPLYGYNGTVIKHESDHYQKLSQEAQLYVFCFFCKELHSKLMLQ